MIADPDQITADTDKQVDASDKPAAKTKSADAKPAKDTKSANDNDAPANAQPQPETPQPDASIIVQAQAALIAAQTPPPAAQSVIAANDRDSDTEQASAVNEPANAKRAPAPLPNVPADTKAPADPALAAAQSPVAAAQAALKTGNISGKSADTKNDAADKAKPADAGNAQPQIQSQQQQQPAPEQTSAPTSTISAAVAPSHTMPVQTASSGHDVSAAVQVAPQTPTPDVNGLAVEIAARSQSGAKEFQIRLDPPELGRVDVRLSIDATGKAEAHLTADRPEALTLLQKDSGTLTQALRNAGLDVSQNGLNFSLRGQNGNGGHQAPDRMPRSHLTATRVIDAVQNASTISFTGGNGRLDIHV